MDSISTLSELQIAFSLTKGYHGNQLPFLNVRKISWNKGLLFMHKTGNFEKLSLSEITFLSG